MNKNYGFFFLSKFVKIKLNSKVGKHFPTCFLGKMLKWKRKTADERMEKFLRNFFFQQSLHFKQNLIKKNNFPAWPGIRPNPTPSTSWSSGDKTTGNVIQVVAV